MAEQTAAEVVSHTDLEVLAPKVKDIMAELKADWLTDYLTKLLVYGNEPQNEDLVINHLRSLKKPQKRDQVLMQVSDSCDASQPYNCNGQCQSYPCAWVSE